MTTPPPPPNRALALSLATLLKRYGSRRYRFEARILRDLLDPIYARFILEQRAGISGGPAAQELLRLIEEWKRRPREPMPIEPLERRLVAGARTVQRYTERTLKSIGIITSFRGEDALRQVRLSAFLTANQVDEVLQTRINQTATMASDKVIKGRPLRELMREAGALANTMDRADNLRARNIAGDVTAQTTKEAYEQAGITEFEWVTQGDARVRSKHRELNGQRFKVGTGAPGEGHPGEPRNCRCYAVPVAPGKRTTLPPIVI